MSSKTLIPIVKFMESKAKDTLIFVKVEGLETLISLRLVKYSIGGISYTLATTLLDKNIFTAGKLKSLYHDRWGIETLFKSIKDTFKLEQFHSKKPNGIRQEISAIHLVQVIGRILELESEEIKKRKPGRPKNTQVNKKGCIILMSSFLSNCQKERIVTNQESIDLLKFAGRNIYYSRKGRSFPRKSRQPINKWSRKRNIRKNPCSLRAPPLRK